VYYGYLEPNYINCLSILASDKPHEIICSGYNMNTKEIEKLIQQGEGQTVEFKLRPSEEIGKAISAFANSNDGHIFVGVSDAKDIVGISEKMEMQVASIAHSCKPSIYPEIRKTEINDKTILVVNVKRTGCIHAYKNIAYRRVGSHDQPLSPEEVINFARNTGQLGFDDLICETATIDDIDEERIKWFLRKAAVERNLDIDSETPKSEVLSRLDLMVNQKLTNAAVLMFGKSPQRFFLQARIRCARFKGTTPLDFIDMKENESITNREYQRIFNVTRVTAYRELNDLVEKDVIEKVGKTGKWVYYR
jgi:ATP-dependent DNA helicase RecG